MGKEIKIVLRPQGFLRVWPRNEKSQGNLGRLKYRGREHDVFYNKQEVRSDEAASMGRD